MIPIKVNENSDDRRGRITLGIFVLAVGIALEGTWGAVLVMVGLMPLISGLVGWCPIYALFNIKHAK